MKYHVLLAIILMISCDQALPVQQAFLQQDWSSRKVNISPSDSLHFGKSYLSVYSQMYSFSENKRINLTGIISMRNVSETDTIFMKRADYYDTHGEKLRTYIKNPIFISPMETLEIVITQNDIEGGTGSNFIFEWLTPAECHPPLIEGLMNSMQGTLGVTFTTQSHRLE